MGEQYFERRIQKKLESRGWLVINCARSKPFDLVAMKDGETVLIEVKGKKTKYPYEQFMRQIELSDKAGAPMVVVRQGMKKNTILINKEPYDVPIYYNWVEKILVEDLR